MTKSITSLLVELAIEQGYLTGVDETILLNFSKYLPLGQSDERMESITIKDLLTMRHGMDCDDWDPDSPTYHENNFPFDEPDVIKTTLNFPLLFQPGSQFS